MWSITFSSSFTYQMITSHKIVAELSIRYKLSTGSWNCVLVNKLLNWTRSTEVNRSLKYTGTFKMDFLIFYLNNLDKDKTTNESFIFDHSWPQSFRSFSMCRACLQATVSGTAQVSSRALAGTLTLCMFSNLADKHVGVKGKGAREVTQSLSISKDSLLSFLSFHACPVHLWEE